MSLIQEALDKAARKASLKPLLMGEERLQAALPKETGERPFVPAPPGATRLSGAFSRALGKRRPALVFGAGLAVILAVSCWILFQSLEPPGNGISRAAGGGNGLKGSGPKPSPFEISGITFSETGSIAVINGLVVSAGDQVDESVRVKEIQERLVILESGGELIELPL